MIDWSIFHTYSGQEQVLTISQKYLDEGGMGKQRQQLLTTIGKVLNIWIGMK